MSFFESQPEAWTSARDFGRLAAPAGPLPSSSAMPCCSTLRPAGPPSPPAPMTRDVVYPNGPLRLWGGAAPHRWLSGLGGARVAARAGPWEGARPHQGRESRLPSPPCKEASSRAPETGTRFPRRCRFASARRRRSSHPCSSSSTHRPAEAVRRPSPHGPGLPILPSSKTRGARKVVWGRDEKCRRRSRGRSSRRAGRGSRRPGAGP